MRNLLRYLLGNPKNVFKRSDLSVEKFFDYKMDYGLLSKVLQAKKSIENNSDQKPSDNRRRYSLQTTTFPSGKTVAY